MGLVVKRKSVGVFILLNFVKKEYSFLILFYYCVNSGLIWLVSEVCHVCDLLYRSDYLDFFFYLMYAM